MKPNDFELEEKSSLPDPYYSWKIGALISILILTNAVYMTSIIYIYSTTLTASDDETWRVKTKTLNQANPQKSIKRVQIWSGLKGFDDIHVLGLDNAGLEIQNQYCNYSCEFTNDKPLLSGIDAVIFDGRALDIYAPHFEFVKNNMFRKENNNPLTVFFMLEPPTNEKIIPEIFNNFFNLTMTYREDSNIYVPFGRLVPLGKNDHANTISSEFLKTKTKKVAWIYPEFEIPGTKSFVKELSKYIAVDVYGKYGNYTCKNNKDPDSCMKEIGKTHKFYISLETSICMDYIPESFFGALKHGMVPILLNGAGNYTKFAPDGAYIDASSFASVEDLASYLVKLDEDDDSYLKYFDWKRSFQVERISVIGRALCNLCSALSENTGLNSGSVQDLNYWWHHKGDLNVCAKEKPFVSKMGKKVSSRLA